MLHCTVALKVVFQKYAGVTLSTYAQYLQPLMDKESFGRFLEEEQGETKEEIKFILKGSKEKMSFYEFCAYLESEISNHPVDYEDIPEDLPLTDYFCYSSHNTYLTGNQLTSDSKIERYL